MLTRTTIESYFQALSTRNGPLAASLFTEDGVIDDLRGKHHAGRESIGRFIGQVPVLNLEFLSGFITQPQRVTVYGYIHYPGKDSLLIRWVFTGDGEQIAHLCNSRIEQVPPERLR